MNYTRPALLGLFAAALLTQGATDYKIQTRYPIAGSGGWDYITIDAPARRLYVSHATQVEVLNVDNGQLIGTIADTPGVHGIAIAPEFKHGFTSNGKENKVSVFDPSDLHLIKKIDVGQGPDGIYYDAASKRVFINNHGSNDITAIDAEALEIVGTVQVDGAGEQMVTGRDGLLYVNLEDKSEVVAFDAKSLAIKHRFPIGVAKTPTGLAFDPSTNRLFIGCREEPRMVMMDAATGKVAAHFPIGKGVDAAAFDPDTRLIFASSGEGTLAVFHEVSADKYEDVGAVQTQQSAKTLALDPVTKKVFLPAAEFDVVPSAEPGGRAKRTMKPGSFVVLVVGK
jgi:DNA-binding beta-propeller fold protein YncE